MTLQKYAADWWFGVTVLARRAWSTRRGVLVAVPVAAFLSIPIVVTAVMVDLGIVSRDVGFLGGMMAWMVWVLVVMGPIVTADEERRRSEEGA